MKKYNWVISALFILMFAHTYSLAAQNGEDFKVFLKKFTTSATFQYSRIKFPLKTGIILSAGDDEHEKAFPFTKKEWPLLDSEAFEVVRDEVEGDGVFVSKFTVMQPTVVEFESGYEDSELDLSTHFDLIDGKWYLTDCYTSWYNFGVLASELPQVIKEVQAENKAFIKEHP